MTTKRTAKSAEVSVTDAITQVEAVLKQLRSVSITPASVNPDGTPGAVAPSEVIESAWGNAVVDTLNALHVRRPQAAQVTATSVACPATTLTQITFTTQVADTDDLVVPGADMTINLTGLWLLTAHADGSASWGADSSIRLYLGSTARIYTGASAATDQMTVSGMLLNGGASATVRVYIYNAGGATITANTVSLSMTRIYYT